MADVAGRVRLLERKLDFIMTNLRMKAALQTGVVDANGQPVIKTFDGSLLELYHLSREIATAAAEDLPIDEKDTTDGNE